MLETSNASPSQRPMEWAAPTRICVGDGGQLPAVREYLAPVMVLFEELNRPPWHVDDLHGLVRGNHFRVQQLRNPQRIARPHRIVADRRRHRSRTISGYVLLKAAGLVPQKSFVAIGAIRRTNATAPPAQLPWNHTGK